MSELILLVDREEVVAEAKSWLGTPYKRGKNHCLKGVGCDCATFIAEVLVSSGLVVREEMDRILKEVGHQGDDWFQHTDEERYMFRLLRHGAKVLEGVAYPSTRVEPGNIVASRVVGSRLYNHAGVVTKWPRAIQSVKPVVNEVDVTTDPLWMPQQIAIFDPWVRDAR